MPSAILNAMITVLMRSLIGGVNWMHVKNTILSLADVNLTGAEKRQAALYELKAVLADFSTSMMNFAIEAAVISIKKDSSHG
ncbi:hypothetical protein [Candidatus Contendibacter odensensis]|uniref:Uncharacterized protein n=1 Tax=Candidatus Contendobacter odensis Run_B_J11 TaxID=1400861 RepID=A0A7U7G8G0_9GAMM|nr:hypothetical protein [Candidatus Contendobacter odensis]CDH43845.1 hypothetical protein BN874_1370010 [Candidatus Contendobacter odensis Run_B_J11]